MCDQTEMFFYRGYGECLRQDVSVQDRENYFVEL